MKYYNRSNAHSKKLDGRKNHIIKGNTKNNTKEQEVLKELEKDEGQVWEDDGIIYIEEKIYIPNNQKIWEQIL